MSPQAVDFSFARPNPADLAAAGYLGALRYLAPLPNAKVITGDEIASLHANDLAVGFVWESGASRSGQGQDAGTADATTANVQADSLGVPDTVTLYFAVDFDADPITIDPYFRGVKGASKRPVGVYGSFRVVEHLLDAGLVVKAWQTAAWSHGQHSARAVLFQRADPAANPPPGCDVNDILQDDWGQWPANGGTVFTPEQEQLLINAATRVTEGAHHTDEFNTLKGEIEALTAKVDSLQAGGGPHGDIPATIHYP